MTEFWETCFQDKQLMWGAAPARSAVFARDSFREQKVRDVLIPGIGYGRNAKPFLDAGMSVTGIEIAPTAIEFARTLSYDFPIHCGSVLDMPFDDQLYDGIFCYALIHLLDAKQREKLRSDCFAQLRPGGQMIFTVISKESPTYGAGSRIATDQFEVFDGVRMFFFDEHSIQQEFARYGLVESHRIEDRSNSSGDTLPFFNIVCRKSDRTTGS